MASTTVPQFSRKRALSITSLEFVDPALGGCSVKKLRLSPSMVPDVSKFAPSASEPAAATFTPLSAPYQSSPTLLSTAPSPSSSSSLSLEYHEGHARHVKLPPISLSSANNEANGRQVRLPSIWALLDSPSSPSSSSEASILTSDSRSLSDFDSDSDSSSDEEMDSDSESESDSDSSSDEEMDFDHPDLASQSLMQAPSFNAAGSGRPDESLQDYLLRTAARAADMAASPDESLIDYLNRKADEAANPLALLNTLLFPLAYLPPSQPTSNPALWWHPNHPVLPTATAPTAAAAAIVPSAPSSNPGQIAAPARANASSSASTTLQGRVAAFIPKISAANKALEADRTAGKLAAKNIEDVEEDEEHIEMVSETRN